MSTDTDIEFFTFGMFIIDEIHFPPPRKTVYNVIGGAGAYCALGARLFSPGPDHSRSVGWIVDCGSDFPKQVRDVILSWNTSCLLRHTPNRLTTRGWNEYGADEYRDFKYLTPKIRLEAKDLTTDLLKSKGFHMVCAPGRAIQIVSETVSRTQSESTPKNKPVWVWEPVPGACHPDELDETFKAAKMVDIISPNHQELALLFGVEALKANGTAIDRTKITELSLKLIFAGIGADGGGAVVVRCGKEGCYFASSRESGWLPAYHVDSSYVVDPTGGGNSFLGAVAIALARGESLEMACVRGTIAASFVIEQIGMPGLTTSETTQELWNGASPMSRFNNFVHRLATRAEDDDQTWR